MKKLIMIAFSTLAGINGAEYVPQRKAVEWDAKLYAQGNKVQFAAFCSFLEINKINFDNKRILSLGSGTGEIEHMLAKQATWIDGIDPSINMVQFAQNKYREIPHLKFHHAFAEDFKGEKPYDLTFASFSFHWFEDKQQVLKNVCNNLATDGEFFFNAPTSDDPKPLNLIVTEEIMSSPAGAVLTSALELFSTNRSKSIGSSYPSREELKNMIGDAGFEILQCEQQSSSVILKNRQEVENFQRPIVMSRPIIQSIPEMMQNCFFSLFIDKILSYMKKTDNQEYINELITTIVHVRKKSNPK